MEKRGQITLFVIIGIILLLLSSIGFYFFGLREHKIEQPPIPVEIEPIANYIKVCLEDYGEIAANTLGLQAGYITLPDYIDQDPWGYLEYLPDSGIKLPYWYYRGVDRWPEIPEIEADVSRYINSHLKRCIGNFSGFTGQFDIKELAPIETTTTLTNEDMTLKLEYPLKITELASGKVTDYSTYIAHIPVRVKKVYSLARELMEKENQDMFLEDVSLNLMVLDPEIPFSDMRFKCGKLRWTIPEIVASLKESLFWNMPRIRVDNTDYPEFKLPISEYKKYDRYDQIYVPQLEEYIRPTFKGKDVTEFENLQIPDNIPEDMYEYKQMFWKDAIGSDDYGDLQVNLVFNSDSDIKLRARPSRNGILKSSEGKGQKQFLNFLCLNIYHFTYDVEFPVEINVYDQKSFNGEGYNFKFATPVMIHHNLPDRGTKAISTIVPRDRDTEFCDEVGDDEYKIQARNSINNQELKDVKISFECGRFSCSLGNTQLEGLNYQLTSLLPKNCGPGRIAAELQGYLRSEETVPDMPENRVFVKLTPLYPVALNIVRRESDDLDTDLALKITHRVSVRISNEELDYTVYKVIDMSKPDTLKPTIEIPYLDASYDVDIVLMDEPEGQKPVMVGGYNANWTVIAEDDFIPGTTELTFRVLEKVPLPASDSAKLKLFLDLEDQSIKNKLAPSTR